MTSKQTTWKWTKEYQKAFEQIKKAISGVFLLAHSEFIQQYVIHTNISKVQLGAIINQDN